MRGRSPRKRFVKSCTRRFVPYYVMDVAADGMTIRADALFAAEPDVLGLTADA
jgi:hypothetical protein